MQNNLWNARWELTQPHIVKWNSPQLTTEIGSVAMIGGYVNTRASGLSVMEIVPYTHIIVIREVLSHPSEIPVMRKRSPIKDHINLRVEKDQATSTTNHSQNITAENQLKYY
jgi:hypothetical protein